MRCSGVQYRCIFLLVLCILTRPAGSSKYCRTRKNIQRYCTPKHPIRYMYSLCFAGQKVLGHGNTVNDLIKFLSLIAKLMMQLTTERVFIVLHYTQNQNDCSEQRFSGKAS